jgi:hypothetical protein
MMLNLRYFLSKGSQFRLGFSAEAICFDTYKFLLSLMAFPLQWCWSESEKLPHGDGNRLLFDFPT